MGFRGLGVLDDLNRDVESSSGVEADELERTSIEKGRVNSSTDCKGGVKGDSGSNGGRKGIELGIARLLGGFF